MARKKAKKSTMRMKACLAKENYKRTHVFGRLTVIDFDAGRTKGGHILWRCRCDCGEVVTRRRHSVTCGDTRSCGCLRVERTREQKTTHGLSSTLEYKTWSAMLNRCNNPRNKDWANYGGRGIKVCDRWNDFENFLADMGEKPEGDEVSIDRRNNGEGYSPENCGWSGSLEEQARNRRTNRPITFQGKTQSVVEWAEELDICYETLLWRLDHPKWTVERALTQPVQKKCGTKPSRKSVQARPAA